MKKVLNSMFVGALLVVAIFGISLLGAGSASAADKIYTVRIQSQYPSGDLSCDLLQEFAKAAEKRSNGQLKVKVFQAGQLLPGEEAFTGCMSGAAEIAQGSAYYAGRINPMASIEFGLPLTWVIPNVEGFEAKGEAIRTFWKTSGLYDIFSKAYAEKGLYYLGPNTFGTAPITLARKPVVKCGDLQGRVIRSAGALADLHTAAGIKSAVIEGSETYMALKMGTVDMSDYDTSCITGLKWHEVAPYWIRGTEEDHLMGTVVVNMTFWKSLPAELQTALQDAHSKDYWQACLKGYNEDMDKVMELVKQGKVIINKLPDDCVEKYRKKALEIWEKEAARGPSYKKAIQLIKEWKGMK